MKVVVFLMSGKHRVLGSNTLRGEQLCRICKWAFADQAMSFYTAYSDLNICEATVFLTKSYLGDTSERELDRLKRAGNVLCADFLDAKVNSRIVDRVDVVVASSRLQERYLQENFRKPVVHVTHHVDFRVPDVVPQEYKFRCGYFGDPQNGALSGLDKEVDVVEAMDPRNIIWMTRLPDYNCHYGVRQDRERDGFKPFTKGFLAAHCRSPIVVSADDAEAEIALGRDYPYRWDATALQDAAGSVRSVAESFRTRPWFEAIAAMEYLNARNAPDVIRGELKSLLGTAAAL